jgi:branched-chain amino acid transport system permease protein
MIYSDEGQFKTSYAKDMAVFPLVQDRHLFIGLLLLAFIGVPALAVAGVPPFNADYIFKAILTPFLILSLAALGLNILVGYCGQISLGAGAFMAVGAYAAFNFATRIPEMPVVIAMLLGGAVSAGVGVCFGIPSLRIKGLYLAVATLAAQFFFDWLFLRVRWFTNNSSSGSVNAPELNVFGWLADSAVERYVLVLTFVVVFGIVAKNLIRSDIGRQWMATRDMDLAAEIIGIRPVRAKLTAFAISSFVIGVAGALWAFVNLGSWEPNTFSIDRSLQILFMVIIGGLGSIVGCFLGAGFILLLPIILEVVPSTLGIPLSTDTVSNMTMFLFGAMIVFFLVIEPHGLARLWMILKEKLKIWPFPY